MKTLSIKITDSDGEITNIPETALACIAFILPTGQVGCSLVGNDSQLSSAMMLLYSINETLTKGACKALGVTIGTPEMRVLGGMTDGQGN